MVVYYLVHEGDKSTPIGFVHMIMAPDEDAEMFFFSIEFVYVLPEYRRMGCSRVLREAVYDLFNQKIKIIAQSHPKAEIEVTGAPLNPIGEEFCESIRERLFISAKSIGLRVLE